MTSASAPALPDAPDLAEVTASESALRRFLHGLPGVDEVGATQRAADLATRSIKREAKLFAIDLAIRMTDLTTLEGQDTPGRVRSLCAKALHPDPSDPEVPPVAAVCIYPDLVPVAVEALARSGSDGGRAGASDGGGTRPELRPGGGSEEPPYSAGGSDGGGTRTVRVASVATAFPSGRAALEVKLADVRGAVDAGADEIDMVIDRGAFLAGRYAQVLDEIQQVKVACGDAHLKAILETGELATLDNVRRASWLALAGGADVIKTSTGKVTPAATLPVTLVMLEAVRDFQQLTGALRGVKAAGGIRTTKEAVRYLVLVHEIAGPQWLTPELFRFGASSLLDDLLLQRHKQRTGRYWGGDYLTLG